MGMAEAGRLWLPENDPYFPLADVEGQLLRFTGDPKQDGHDDIVDTLSMVANRIITKGLSGTGKPVKIAGVLREPLS